VQDNGIGFDAKYAEQIFEVFKRLHGRDIYPGSGIGLALCRRIVTNHAGILFASSIPGKGSHFHIILPDRQKEEAPASQRQSNF
jgi:signal transduction histidine kinase